MLPVRNNFEKVRVYAKALKDRLSLAQMADSSRMEEMQQTNLAYEAQLKQLQDECLNSASLSLHLPCLLSLTLTHSHSLSSLSPPPSQPLLSALPSNKTLRISAANVIRSSTSTRRCVRSSRRRLRTSNLLRTKPSSAHKFASLSLSLLFYLSFYSYLLLSATTSESTDSTRCPPCTRSHTPHHPTNTASAPPSAADSPCGSSRRGESDGTADTHGHTRAPRIHTIPSDATHTASEHTGSEEDTVA